jgi:fructosamine kinase
MQPEILSFIQQIIPGPTPPGSRGPVQSGTPGPFQATVPGPHHTTSSEPLQATSSDSLQATSPGSHQATSPGRLQATSSEPLQATSPDPIQTTSSDSIQTTSSDSFQATSPDPRQATSPNPIPTGSPLPLQFYPVGGGSINAAYRIRAKDDGQPSKDKRPMNKPSADKRQATKGNPQATTEGGQAAKSPGQWFCKITDAALYPGLFAKERDGLALLGAQHAIRVPAVIACETIATSEGPKQVLVMEWIEPGVRTEGFWRLFGEQLARLHQVTQDPFGLSDNNYMGVLPQDNDLSSNWVDFFIQQRLTPQIRLAANKGLLGQEVIRQFERLYKVLPGIFPDVAPSLLHGDNCLPEPGSGEI